MRRRLYHLLRATLSQSRRTALRKRLAVLRLNAAPLLRRWHGTFDTASLLAEIQGRLPGDFEVLMVHCSLNDVQPMYVDSPGELLDGLVGLCGPSRTLAMPAFFLGGPDGDSAGWYRARPRFDARRQPSQMGILSELFRRRAGVRRSLHPTAGICALGPLAEELTADHHNAPTAYGEGTPWALMASRHTVILGIGTYYERTLTQIHAAEDLLGDRFPVRVRAPERVAVEVLDTDGVAHSLALAFNAPDEQRRTELLGRLLTPAELSAWRFHGVPLYVTSAAAVTGALVRAAERGETIYASRPIRG